LGKGLGLAAEGHPERGFFGLGHADAQVNLGVMYANDRGVPQNDGDALKWYRRAADCYSACNFDPLSWGIGVQN
jgi:TPR repeat protein